MKYFSTIENASFMSANKTLALINTYFYDQIVLNVKQHFTFKTILPFGQFKSLELAFS